MKTRIIIVTCALVLISCDKRDPELDSKLSQLEKQATEAIERQRQLELELAEQKILAERDAIERERTIIEQERIAMEELKDAQNANALAELERRQAELIERERRISDNQNDLDRRQQLLTGLESELSERELDLAGREPLDVIPPIEKNYVSGPTGDFTNFYEPLAAYGSWFQTSDYGYVYQPTIVRESTWRPYTRGRWAFTDHGWTWVSNEPFGWACYHYGRWALLRNIGWVWIPGNQWAPAWVSWRESQGHIGWAPLPPETLVWHSNSWDSGIDLRFGIDSTWFSFVSYRNFGNDISSYCLPYAQNLVIYQSTTTVTHYVFRDRIVYCGGPRYRNVCDRIGRKFPIHRIRHDYSPDFGRGGRRLHSQFSGNELLVVAPRMDAEWNPALRPSRVSRDLGQVVVSRSNELPEDVRNQYRQRRQEDEEVAARWVSNTGGREAFENDRKTRIEKNREIVVKNESLERADREPGSGKISKTVRPQSPVLNETSDGTREDGKRPNVRDSRPLNAQDESSSKSPRHQLPEEENVDNRTAPDKQAAKDLRQQQEAAREERVKLDHELKLRQEQQADQMRQQQLEAKKAQQKQEELELGQRQQQEKIQRLDQQQEQDKRSRDQKDQEERLRELKDKQELDRKEQQERLRAQQEQIRQAREQQERLREQQAQQEQAGKQQEETQRRLKEQQEQLRAQKEQQEKYREQQEQLRQAREQQEQLRAQQQQQENMRAQQEQQERMRQQQEEAQRRAQEQQERMRAQQEQQERARQQQEESQRRAQEDAQRRMEEQQERQRAQQEQQERARQQQEESQRRERQRQ